METKDPYLLLIEKSLGRLTLKYKSEFRYEVHKLNIGFSFTIYQGESPIFFKEVPVLETTEQINNLYYQVLIDFFSGGIERILMQKENEKRLFRKTHAGIKEDGNIHTTKGHW
jgi:hypothetical protein